MDFLLERDVERLFQFAPLQGEKAKSLLPADLHADLTTVVLWSQGQVFVRSDAVLMILAQLGGIWTLTRVGWIVPKGLRDLVYRMVAARRYSWFGQRETCRLPTPAERARFLD